MEKEMDADIGPSKIEFFLVNPILTHDLDRI